MCISTYELKQLEEQRRRQQQEAAERAAAIPVYSPEEDDVIPVAKEPEDDYGCGKYRR